MLKFCVGLIISNLAPQGRRVTAQRNALGKKSPLKLRALQGQGKKFPLPLQGAFSGNANPARRKIDRADFPLGWAVTPRRFAATVGMIY
ncbi:MAG: hypothetical protein LBP75_04065 [Planctomycetota bacterium]|jgi:hypothetical protein|nr:hypothetical protein [Planctomycetota bacterium]